MPEPTSINRAVGFNKPSVDRFFEAYKAELEKKTFDASKIYNMDESGLTVVHRPGKVIAKRGQKKVGKIVSGEKGQTVTVICSFSASGNYIHPALIFKRKRMTNRLLHGTPSGTVGYCSENGWTNNEVFLKWLEHFTKFAKPTKDEPVILILDGHGSHKTLAAVDFARDHGIVMISLPPHTTHELQPLDLTFYGALKAHYNSECDKWMVNHPGHAYHRMIWESCLAKLSYEQQQWKRPSVGSSHREYGHLILIELLPSDMLRPMSQRNRHHHQRPPVYRSKVIIFSTSFHYIFLLYHV